MTATVLLDSDIAHDATDCRTAYEAGNLSLKGGGNSGGDTTGGIDFGDDASPYSNDGECDDPRFEGPGMTATVLLDSDIAHDATDCRTAYEAGNLTLKGGGNSGNDSGGPLIVDGIEFGSDGGVFANDGECDDPRFAGPGVAGAGSDNHLMNDATDCFEAYEGGFAWLKEQNQAPIVIDGIEFGADGGVFANDGECDDPRFEGPGVAGAGSDGHIMNDATDCAQAYTNGSARLRADMAPIVIDGIDFGVDTGVFAHDGECDDPRFEGPGAAASPTQNHLKADATDCSTAWTDSRIALAGESGPPEMVDGIDFGDDSSAWAHDGECDDPRFEGPRVAGVTNDSDAFHDASDCHAAYMAGDAFLKAGNDGGGFDNGGVDNGNRDGGAGTNPRRGTSRNR